MNISLITVKQMNGYSSKSGIAQFKGVRFWRFFAMVLLTGCLASLEIKQVQAKTDSEEEAENFAYISAEFGPKEKKGTWYELITAAQSESPYDPNSKCFGKEGADFFQCKMELFQAAEEDAEP